MDLLTSCLSRLVKINSSVTDNIGTRSDIKSYGAAETVGQNQTVKAEENWVFNMMS